MMMMGRGRRRCCGYIRRCLLTCFYIGASSLTSHRATSLSSTSSTKTKRVIVVGGGISGLLVGHVLQQSDRHNYKVTVLEASDRLGGNIRSIVDPNDDDSLLNIGHATHLGMFWNLRLLLRYLDIPEWPVGRGRNDQAGLFRMISLSTTGTRRKEDEEEEGGSRYQPPLHDILSLHTWWEAFRFYYHSHLHPDQRLEDFLERHCFSNTFLSIVYWSMMTFEFDKSQDEIRDYAVGTARALLITQVFFKFLLCDAFQGVLPSKLQEGLYEDLVERVLQSECRNHAAPSQQQQQQRELRDIMKDLAREPLASYFSADYSRAMQRLAEGAGTVRTKCNVTRIVRSSDDEDGCIRVETAQGETFTGDDIVLTIQPSSMLHILHHNDFANHVAALKKVESGAVGVSIIRASDLPFPYPPDASQPDDIPSLDVNDAHPILGIFDISELTTTLPGDRKQPTPAQAGWLSVAFPVYAEESRNRHQHWLRDIPCLDATIYPWTKATASFPRIRRELVNLQGTHGVYLTGHTLTGVNKASELQVVNALCLCRDYFHAEPPWKFLLGAPLLPDCNDEDAFRPATSPFEAARLAMKNLLGSFLLVGVVSRFGSRILE